MINSYQNEGMKRRCIRTGEASWSHHLSNMVEAVLWNGVTCVYWWFELSRSLKGDICCSHYVKCCTTPQYQKKKEKEKKDGKHLKSSLRQGNVKFLKDWVSYLTATQLSMKVKEYQPNKQLLKAAAAKPRQSKYIHIYVDLSDYFWL